MDLYPKQVCVWWGGGWGGGRGGSKLEYSEKTLESQRIKRFNNNSNKNRLRMALHLVPALCLGCFDARVYFSLSTRAV